MAIKLSGKALLFGVPSPPISLRGYTVITQPGEFAFAVSERTGESFYIENTPDGYRPAKFGPRPRVAASQPALPTQSISVLNIPDLIQVVGTFPCLKCGGRHKPQVSAVVLDLGNRKNTTTGYDMIFTCGETIVTINLPNYQIDKNLPPETVLSWLSEVVVSGLLPSPFPRPKNWAQPNWAQPPPPKFKFPADDGIEVDLLRPGLATGPSGVAVPQPTAVTNASAGVGQFPEAWTDEVLDTLKAMRAYDERPIDTPIEIRNETMTARGLALTCCQCERFVDQTISFTDEWRQEVIRCYCHGDTWEMAFPGGARREMLRNLRPFYVSESLRRPKASAQESAAAAPELAVVPLDGERKVDLE